MIKFLIPGLLVSICLSLGHCQLNSCKKCIQNCHPIKEGMLNIHLVPHTHDDAGWVKTVDQYYYGGKDHYARSSVQHIIDSVIMELEADPDRRFVYVESAFLWRWWNDRGDYHRNLIKKLVRQGRLQILGGGWVMSDEATPHYSALIEQMTTGLRFEHEIFGECGHPNIAWQIDPFGHSAEASQQFADMGYDAVFYGRIDYIEMEKRKREQQMEMIWKINPELGHDGELFTGILYNLYHPPAGFCFDVLCGDQPIIDSKVLHGYNVEARVNQFISSINTWKSSYKTNHVMVPMGGDFTYMVAGKWFVNIEKLIKYSNDRKWKVNMIYSTPSCYLQALHESNITWPVKVGSDFFTYRSREKDVWSGYFTSKPTLKYMTSRINNLLQVIKQMNVFQASLSEEQEIVSRAAALMNHHDAISGTEKNHVAADYALYLSEAVTAGQTISIEFYRNEGDQFEHHAFCMLLNISSCPFTEIERHFIISLYNPLSRNVSTYVRVPVVYSNYIIFGAGDYIELDVIPLAREVMQLPGRESIASHEILFKANLPPMGYRKYSLRPRDLSRSYHLNIHDIKQVCDRNTLGNIIDCSQSRITVGFEEDFRLIFKRNGLLHKIVINGVESKFEQKFGYYSQSALSFPSSGAYIFTSGEEEPTMLNNATLSFYKGANVIQIYQVFDNWASQIIKIYKNEFYIEFDWTIGPLISSDRKSKEVITRYNTHIENNGIFYTDSNGRRFMKRKFDNNEWTSESYYPVTTAARIKGSTAILTVLTDRAQGATSPLNGSLEFLIHRKTYTDDNKGVEEPLNENQFNTGIVVRGSHIVKFSPIESVQDHIYFHRLKAADIAFAPWISFFDRKPQYNMMKSFLKTSLPDNVHILTLEKLNSRHLLVRLEHIFESKEHDVLSSPVTIDLYNLFQGITIERVLELNLSGNQLKSCISRLKWKKEERDIVYEETYRNTTMNENFITIFPMEIRTFLFTIA